MIILILIQIRVNKHPNRIWRKEEANLVKTSKLKDLKKVMSNRLKITTGIIRRMISREKEVIMMKKWPVIRVLLKIKDRV